MVQTREMRRLDLLLIEDREDHAELFEQQLELSELSATFRWVRSLEESRVAMATRLPDVIVLDLGLPESQGIATLKTLDPSSCGAPIVVVTSAADLELAREAIGLGAQDYLCKFDMSSGSIARAIQNAVERFGLLRELEQTNTSLCAFASAAAHDVNAPLRNITATMQLSREALADGETEHALKWIGEAERISLRLSDLVHSLLAFSRLGGTVPQREPCSLRELALEATHNLAKQVADSGARIEMPGEDVTLRGSRQLLVYVLQNLVENALTYHEGTPTIRIRGRQVDLECVVTVEDDGIGIPREFLKEIFLPLRRLHTDHGRYGGSGIGLASCERIVRAHGGRIWAESEPGRGSRFHFALPLGE